MDKPRFRRSLYKNNRRRIFGWEVYSVGEFVIWIFIGKFQISIVRTP